MTDVSNDMYMIRCGILEAVGDISPPHVRMRPRVFPDGDQWCCLYGADLQIGVAGFGDTPDAACRAFDTAWNTEKPPPVRRPIAPELATAIEGFAIGSIYGVQS